ncbi:MAG TPA: lysophospholipid acyltransferase family protein [Candidatus Angelobacter sp.]
MRASSGPATKVFRVLIRGSAFVCLACLCLADCLLHGALRKLDAASRPRILQRWSKRILSCIKVHVWVLGPTPAQGLIVSNHLSYLDILVLSSVAHCMFVSKSEVKSWPLVGWIARMTGTVFVDRGRPSQTNRPQEEMQERLKAGAPLVLFPEGTSTDGRQMLPFLSSLFEAVIELGAPVTAAHVSYELAEGDGDPATDICYWGEMTLFPHFIKLLTKTSVKVTVRFSSQPKIFGDRKQAALEMQREVAELGNSVANSPQMALQQ